MSKLSRLLFRHYMVHVTEAPVPYLPGIDNGYTRNPRSRYVVVQAWDEDQATQKAIKQAGGKFRAGFCVRNLSWIIWTFSGMG